MKTLLLEARPCSAPQPRLRPGVTPLTQPTRAVLCQDPGLINLLSSAGVLTVPEEAGKMIVLE